MDEENPSRLLIVEGYDDKHVVMHFLKRSETSLSFTIKSVEGYPNLLQCINTEIKAAGRKRLGFLLDADDRLDDHWKEVRTRLKKAGVKPPDKLNPNGYIFGNDPTIGVWIMPNNMSAGELENFVMEMVPSDDPIWPISGRYIDSIPKDKRKFAIAKTDKARLHAWLSTRKEPGRMGAAIGAGDLDMSNQSSANFLNWLENLFA